MLRQQFLEALGPYSLGCAAETPSQARWQERVTLKFVLWPPHAHHGLCASVLTYENAHTHTAYTHKCARTHTHVHTHACTHMHTRVCTLRKPNPGIFSACYTTTLRFSQLSIYVCQFAYWLIEYSSLRKWCKRWKQSLLPLLPASCPQQQSCFQSAHTRWPSRQIFFWISFLVLSVCHRSSI